MRVALSLLSPLVCLCVLCTVVLGQNISLDKLSDCAMIYSLQRTLNEPASTSCRTPHDPAEQHLMSLLSASPQLRTCLLQKPPSNRLAGFSCFDIRGSGSREVLCFHGIAAHELQQYQDNYDPVVAYRYEASAMDCPATNKVASAAPNSLFPQTLAPIATASFGFVVGLGKSPAPAARVYHGFGLLDPSIGMGNRALEVVDATWSMQVTADQPGITRSAGATWREDVVDMPAESQRDFARPFEQAWGERIGVRMRIITISAGGSSQASSADRAGDVDAAQQGIASYLQASGFRNLTSSELANTPFGDTDKMRDLIVQHAPYGYRNSLKGRVASHMVFMVDERVEDCNKVAEVFGVKPEEGVKSDRGGMLLNVFTVGNCAGNGDPNVILDQIIARETEIVRQKMEQP